IAAIPGRGYSFVAPVSDLPGQEFQPQLAEATSSSPGVATGRKSSRISTALSWLTLLLSISALAIWVGPRLALRNSSSPDRISSVAVLPLSNLSNDPGQEFFAVGITDQLITELSK